MHEFPIKCVIKLVKNILRIQKFPYNVQKIQQMSTVSLKSAIQETKEKYLLNSH